MKMEFAHSLMGAPQWYDNPFDGMIILSMVAISAQAVHHLRPTSLSGVMGCRAAAQAKQDAKEDEDLRKEIEVNWGYRVTTIQDWMRDPHVLRKQMEGIEICQTRCAKC